MKILKVRESSFDRINKFQKLLFQNGINNTVESKGDGLYLKVKEKDLDRVLYLAKKNNVYFY
ncbi:hypothetical protein Halha_2261 [Halobacteroides halobius DSM 5150]|uniref:DUF2007 domain-containing protein n=1 Tax=Halobacteroides halobius (strain ATCC 35273 / DSM 5150 / MD-1) TaxID=748449 RepID=L0KC55_HALHC|nr:hypothetical protein [Halobacteroides halobius]AGB42135.1 hypothetical protein Halha_2261 [Halobacteroides halobius DSM 5150]